ncbi:hypothetical protein [Microbispora siamensis]|uniref:DUF3592 domain-containing protein n=1 Tax=Microbispora siamensis TaxID=564413 RepID=A0ABQ4GJZ3_9ACTN|nr:hypothetical protein [Microbispora siamensis]GIH61737.1 hypothetical protein Msi02_25540 [Microbispora siamensis]
MTAGPGAGRRSPAFTAALTFVAVFLLFLAVPNIGPVVRAARADGVPGTFTARSVTCIRHPGHESCTWTGDFRSADGAIRRTGVALYGADRDMLREGQQTPAVDVGRQSRVYGPGGSMEWVFTALLLLAALGILLVAYGPPVRNLLRAHTRARTPAPSGQVPAGR